MELAVSRILVPVDFSRHSAIALRHAMALAQRFGASVELLHVLDVATVIPQRVFDDLAPDQRDARARALEDATNRLDRMTMGASVPTTAIVSIGLPAQAITAFAKANGTDLIVIGTHGHTGIAHAVMGSVAEHVIRNAPCPVLTVRDPDAPMYELPDFANPTLLRSIIGRFGRSRE